MAITSDSELREVVREKYAELALAVDQNSGGCCGPTDVVSRDLYDSSEVAGIPVDALALSLGCGNPTALADLKPGEVVLDLGSGGGIDVLLSARRVGPAGKAYGLDMTHEMLDQARRNQAAAGVTNAEFLFGHIEEVPLPDAAVDVIISNCVVNLSTDKPAVFAEAFRVLRPGGRFAVSDVVWRRPMPPVLEPVVALWTGCISGALVESDYVGLLAAAGFTDISVEPTREYDARELVDIAGGMVSAELLATLDVPELLSQVDGLVFGAFVRATKPS